MTEASEQNGKKVPDIEELYRCFGVLADANDQAGQHAETYLQIVSGTKGGGKEKTLSSQFITRFFKYFPKEMPLAIDAIFDLCEDDDVAIRKAAIKDLSILSKDCPPELLNRIADILTQLLQTDDQTEFAQVQASLLTVFRQNPKSTLTEIFNQITTAELEEVRKRAIKFLVTKIPTLFTTTPPTTPSSPFNKEFEELIVKHVKQVLVDVDAEEFILFVKLLSSLPSMTTPSGKSELIDIIMAQAELDKPFDSNDMERIMILISCIQQAILFFSKSCPSTKYVTFYIRNVLVTLQDMTADDNLKFEILKSLAELSTFYTSAPSLASIACTPNDLDSLFNRLIEYLPKPPDPTTTTSTEAAGASIAEQKPGDDQSRFNFSYVECLLYTFHSIVRHHEAYLRGPDETSKERAREFRLRLQYFAKGTQNYIKELRNSLLSASIANSQNEENKIRRVALKVTTNIDILIKDFFQNPPTYKNSITLSWKSNEMKQLSGDSSKTTTTSAASSTPTPTPTPVQTDTQKSDMSKKRALSTDSSEGSGGGPHKKKPEREIYHPPSGKYSTQMSGGGDDTSHDGNNGAAAFKRRTISTGFQRNGRRF